MVLGTEGLPPREAAWQLVTATWIAHPIRAMAVLGLADHLAAGPRTIDDLAVATGTHAPTLARLVSALVSLGLCDEDGQGRIRLTPIGEFLRADVPGTVRPFALGVMSPTFERAWHELPAAVRTGQPVFSDVHGLGFWDYLAAHPKEGARFDAAMSGGAERARGLLAVRDLASLGTLVDVGGGQGRLLATALAAVPGLRGVLFDRPEVLAGAEPILAEAGVRDRCDLVGGDFFAAVPGGGDAYVLASIIHDWPNEQAVAILRSCHRAMAPGARIWLIENVLAAGKADGWTRLLDLLMLVLFGAQERTTEEYRALLEAAGFAEVTVLPGEQPWSIVEAVRL
jgi:hypothetical protein